MNRNKHIWQRFFVFYNFPLSSTLLLSPPAPAPLYACCVIKLHQNVFAHVNMTSYRDVTNNVYLVTVTTMGLRHCSILEFEFIRGASNHAVAPGITRPLQGCLIRRSRVAGEA